MKKYYRIDILKAPRNNPRNPYGPPVIWRIIREVSPHGFRPHYVMSISRAGHIVWTRDPIHARLFRPAAAEKLAHSLSDLVRHPD